MNQNEKAFYVAALEALDAMEDKRLTKGSMEDIDGCRCFIGEILHRLRPGALASLSKFVTYEQEIEFAANTLEVREDFVLAAIRVNDKFGIEPPQSDAARWAYMRDWTETQLELLEAA